MPSLPHVGANCPEGVGVKVVKVVSLTLATLCVVGAGGYVWADVTDRVPGVLTIAEPIPTDLPPLPSPEPQPSPSEAPRPSADGVAAAVGSLLADPNLGAAVGAIVRDATTGEVLFSRDAEQPRTIASAQKVLSSLAITNHLDLDAVMTTTAVSGAPGEVVLVAAGDTLLATGAGDPTAVVGRAGLADLAAQVAAAAPPGPLTIRLDDTYAKAPHAPAAWNPTDLSMGFTRRVAMIGLADNRPIRGITPHAETDQDVVAAFAAALNAVGRPAAPAAELTGGTPADPAAIRYGEVDSAPYGEVLAHGMEESDNAILENLTRQAMVAAGRPLPADGDLGAFVTEELVASGVPAEQLAITDASGLAPGQLASVNAVDHVLTIALDGKHPALRRIVADLPIAGLTGTMATRFAATDTAPVRGIPRAKTGTLTGVSALAGVTTDVEGRLLTFAVASDQVPRSYAGTIGARAAFDRFAAALTNCGCR